ncbi:hypothetical protein [uncultured Clostridium sp.]|jgi:hypothetical protein|uniref:hypothetical protein n=1 Tax=uncultured Clostridium sp. TaxID=59620 RepID=UPI00260C61EE|nr:hypothetical protein [uncultured Clostridium sp.]
MFEGEVINKMKMLFRFCRKYKYKFIRIILKNGCEVLVSTKSTFIYKFVKNKKIEFCTLEEDSTFLIINCLDIKEIEPVK